MAQHPNVGWLQYWAVGCNRPCDVYPSVVLSDCPSVCSAQHPFVATDRPALVPTANKQGKNVACIVAAAGGSLWRRNGSVWRFRPLESDAESPYICTQTTGCIARLRAAVEIGSPAIRLRTDFYVRQNIARCVSSNSILFGLLPKTLPLQGAWAVPPKSGSPDLEPAVGKGVVAYVAQPLNPHKYER